jgi:hypothetical protein
MERLGLQHTNDASYVAHERLATVSCRCPAMKGHIVRRVRKEVAISVQVKSTVGCRDDRSTSIIALWGSPSFNSRDETTFSTCRTTLSGNKQDWAERTQQIKQGPVIVAQWHVPD